MKNIVRAWSPLIASVAFLLIVTCFLGRFANQETATRALTTNGFTKINLMSRTAVFVGFKGCDKRDLALFTFKAINPAGKPVVVKVCQGWPFKGATIRSV